jgi:hypothetical protein
METPYPVSVNHNVNIGMSMWERYPASLNHNAYLDLSKEELYPASGSQNNNLGLSMEDLFPPSVNHNVYLGMSMEEHYPASLNHSVLSIGSKYKRHFTRLKCIKYLSSYLRNLKSSDINVEWYSAYCEFIFKTWIYRIISPISSYVRPLVWHI